MRETKLNWGVGDRYATDSGMRIVITEVISDPRGGQVKTLDEEGKIHVFLDDTGDSGCFCDLGHGHLAHRLTGSI
jgi:hypothetical protein